MDQNKVKKMRSMFGRKERREGRKNLCCVCASCYSNLAVNSSKWFPSISASSTSAKSAATMKIENDVEGVESEWKGRLRR